MSNPLQLFGRSLMCVAVPICLSGFSIASAQSPKAAIPTSAAPLTEIKVIERVTSGVDRSLEYLASKQRPV